MTHRRHLLLVALTALMMGVGLLVMGTSADAAKATVKLNSVGVRHVGDPIPIVGYLDNTGTRHNKVLRLQRKVNGQWRSVARRAHRADGRFTFPSRVVRTPQITQWRVLVKRNGKLLDVSNRLTVTVTGHTCGSNPSPTTCPQPPAVIQRRDVTNPPVCNPAGGGTVTIEHQTRRQPYVWNPVSKEWELGDPGEWTTQSTDVRAATQAECPPPATGNPVLPDLFVRDLNQCSDAEDTNPDPNVDNCFRIVNTGGRKLLKFPVVTANQGVGDLHIEATRSSSTSSDWQARQIVTMDDGTTTQNFIPAMQFFFAGDGHSHWHIRDFDEYTLLDASGTLVTVGEKHGYCLEDNTSLPGTTWDPIFTHDVVCGVGDQNTTSITHGLSHGWGDTYPSSLPDQAIDITGLPDGVYTVRVRADSFGLVRETNNTNNAATVQVSITGDVVTAGRPN